MALQVFLPLNGNTNNYGSLNGVTIDVTATASATGGKFNKGCYNFTSSTNLIINNVSLNTNQKGYTFSAWVKYSNDSTMFFAVNASNHMNLYTTSGILCWNTGDSAQNPFIKDDGTSVKSLVSQNAWHHYCIVSDSTKTLLYIDGDYAGKAKVHKQTVGTAIQVGGWFINTGYKFTGNANDVRLYDYCLTAQQVKRLAGNTEGNGLQIHLPLNNSVVNTGLKKVTVNAQNATFTDGKVSKYGLECTGNANKYISMIDAPQYKNNFTWSCWFKTTGVSQQFQFIMSQGRDCGACGVSILLNYAKLRLMTWDNSSSIGGAATDKEAVMTTILDTVATDTWYHVAVTFSTTDIKTYLNGELVTTNPILTPDYSQAQGGLVIGKMSYDYSSTSTYFPLSGAINDVRVYNRCLNAEDIKKLTTGLSIHLPFNHFGLGECNLLPNTDTNVYGLGGWKSNGSSISLDTSFKYHNKPTIKIDYTNNTGGMYYPTPIILASNSTYVYSMMMYSTTSYTFNNSYPLHMWCTYNSFTGSDTCHSETILDHTPKIEANKWTKVYIKFKSPTTTDEIKFNPFIYNGFSSGTILHICDVKVEPNDYATRWTTAKTIDSEFVSQKLHLVRDTAGIHPYLLEKYCVIYPLWRVGSPVFDSCIGFEKRYLKTTAPFPTNITSFSISIWIYIDDTTSKTICACRTAVGKGIALFIRGNTIRFDCGGNQSSVTGATININTWYHVCAIKDGTQKYVYVNGKKVGTYSCSLATSNVGSLLTIGESNLEAKGGIGNIFSGYMSDLRIYNTAISEDLVKELYSKGVK